MAKSRKNYKKHRTQRKRKLRRGAGFTENLRGKTRKVNANEQRRITINPNGRNRFNRSGRSYVISNQPIERANEWKESKVLVTNYGPSQSAFYSGPGMQNDYLYHTQKTQPIPHGKDGTLVYSTGHVYKGDFNKGKREGFGTLTIKEGKTKGPTYEGEWKDDKFVPFIEWKKENN